jgi:hypothetical protein
MAPRTLADRGWTPVRRGAIYCSPRCGGGCTHKAFLAATAKAEKTAKRLGAGWTPVVWDNLGWHWRVERGEGDRYPHADVRGDSSGFEATIKAGVYRPYSQHAGFVLQFPGTGKTPGDALESAKQQTRNIRAMLTRAIEAAGQPK